MAPSIPVVLSMSRPELSQPCPPARPRVWHRGGPGYHTTAALRAPGRQKEGTTHLEGIVVDKREHSGHRVVRVPAAVVLEHRLDPLCVAEGTRAVAVRPRLPWAGGAGKHGRRQGGPAETPRAGGPAERAAGGRASSGGMSTIVENGASSAVISASLGSLESDRWSAIHASSSGSNRTALSSPPGTWYTCSSLSSDVRRR